MKKGKIIKINDIEYFISCSVSYEEKVKREDRLFGIKLGILVKDLKSDKYINWEDIKGTYLAEKITDYAENSFNGQNSIYWNWDKEN